MRSRTFIFGVLFLMVIQLTAGCGKDDPTTTCSDIGNTTAKCPSEKACCNGSANCWYEAGGQTFDCNGSDCGSAATALTNYCK